MNIRIASPGGEIDRENVATWWYEELILVVEYKNGETEQIQQGNVIERYL